MYFIYVVLVVRNLLAKAEDKRCRFDLCREDPLEEGMAIHSSILAWRILWTAEPGGLHGIADSDTTEVT